jgi:hypothetical protein
VATSISTKEVRTLFAWIKDGSVKVEPLEDPQEVYCGEVEYMTTSGWRFAVFYDCGCFDYVDWISAPDGRREDFDSMGGVNGILCCVSF